MSENIYADELIDEYEHPHNKGSLSDADVHVHNDNPLCGDELTIYVKVGGGALKDVKFEGSGCVISMGTAGKLTESVKGKSLAEIEALGVPDIVTLIGIDPGPARLKCATLSLRTLKEAVFLYQHKTVDEATKRL